MVDVNSNITSQLVKDHAAAFSTQSKLTNRLWITLVALIFVVVLPAGPSNCVEPYRYLTFGIGCVDSILFDSISFFMLAVLTIAFCQAQAQAIRGYRHAQNVIDKMGEPTSDLVAVQRQFFDSLAIPSLERVGSLPVLILATTSPSGTIKILTSIYYLFLKVLEILVHLGIPIFAIVFTWARLQGNELGPLWLLWIGNGTGVVTLGALAQICYLEVVHAMGTFRKFTKGEIDPIKVY